MPGWRVPLRRILLSMDRRADFVAGRRGPARSRRGVALLAIGMVLFTSSRASSQPPDPDAKHTEPGPPVVSAGEEGFVIQSPTGDYRLQFGLLLQADGRFDAGDDDGEEVDTFALRRVRPQLRGRIAQRFEFFLNPDFAGGTLVLQDAYIDTTVLARVHRAAWKGQDAVRARAADVRCEPRCSSSARSRLRSYPIVTSASRCSARFPAASSATPPPS